MMQMYHCLLSTFYLVRNKSIPPSCKKILSSSKIKILTEELLVKIYTNLDACVHVVINHCTTKSMAEGMHPSPIISWKDAHGWSLFLKEDILHTSCTCMCLVTQCWGSGNLRTKAVIAWTSAYDNRGITDFLACIYSLGLIAHQACLFWHYHR